MGRKVGGGKGRKSHHSEGKVLGRSRPPLWKEGLSENRGELMTVAQVKTEHFSEGTSKGVLARATENLARFLKPLGKNRMPPLPNKKGRKRWEMGNPLKKILRLTKRREPAKFLFNWARKGGS